MLLFMPDVQPEVETKPITDGVVVVPVTRAHWDRARKLCAQGLMADRCVLAVAFSSALQGRIQVGPSHAYVADGRAFEHNGGRYVEAFDMEAAFPGDGFVTLIKAI